MLLNPFLLTTNPFTANVEKKLLYAEASDCGIKPGVVPGGRLYDDACDEGITLLNPRTFVKTHWYRTQEDLQHNGEFGGWRFKPCTEALRRQPQLEGWEVHILND